MAKGENLIVNPEGSSPSSTEMSPSDFKAGVFKMIIRSGVEIHLLYVQTHILVMKNLIDKLNSETSIYIFISNWTN